MIVTRQTNKALIDGEIWNLLFQESFPTVNTMDSLSVQPNTLYMHVVFIKISPPNIRLLASRKSSIQIKQAFLILYLRPF